MGRNHLILCALRMLFMYLYLHMQFGSTMYLLLLVILFMNTDLIIARDSKNSERDLLSNNLSVDLFKAADANGNGELTFKELLDLKLAEVEERKHKFKRKPEDMEEKVERLNNEITRVVENVLKTRDKNQDGVLSLKEFSWETHEEL